MTTPKLWSSGPISLIEAMASLGDTRGEWSRGDDTGVDRAEPAAAADDDGTASEALLGVGGSGGTLGCGRSWAAARVVLAETTGAAVASEDGEAEGDEAGLGGRR
jgi:hypothetical protein